MYDGFDIIKNGSTLLELLVMATIFAVLGYLLAMAWSMRKLNEYWARININKNEITNFKKAINYDDLLTTISTKLATLEKKFSKLKVPTIDQIDLSDFITKDEFRNLKLQNHLNKDEVLDFLNIRNIVKESELSKYLLHSEKEKFALKSDIPDIDLSCYSKKSDFSNFITKSDIPEIDLKEYALKSDLKDFLTKDSEHLKTQDIDESSFVKKNELDSFVRTNQLQKFVQRDDLTSYMKFGDFKNQFNKVNSEDMISGYVKKEDLAPYLKKIDRPAPIDLSSYTNKDDLRYLVEKIDELEKKIIELTPKKKTQLVELDSKGIPKKTITHLLSIKDIVASKSNRDDLQEIKGIGEFIEKKINALGIYTFKQISKLNEEDIKIITEAIKFFPGRIIRDSWVDQAKSKANKLPTFD